MKLKKAKENVCIILRTIIKNIVKYLAYLDTKKVKRLKAKFFVIKVVLILYFKGTIFDRS